MALKVNDVHTGCHVAHEVAAVPAALRRRLLSKAARELLWDQPKKEKVPVVEVIEPRPVYAEANKLRGPETPKFGYSTAPSPASYETKLKVGCVGAQHKL